MKSAVIMLVLFAIAVLAMNIWLFTLPPPPATPHELTLPLYPKG